MKHFCISISLYISLLNATYIFLYRLIKMFPLYEKKLFLCPCEVSSLSPHCLPRRLLADSVACQLFGCFITAASWSDSWALYGVSKYLSEEYARETFGTNEYFYTVRQAIKEVRVMMHLFQLIDHESHFKFSIFHESHFKASPGLSNDTRTFR